MRRKTLVQALLAATGAAMLCGTAIAKDATADTLLAIDKDRGTYIENIVNRFGPQLEQSDAGVTRAQLRELLQKLRADHLMAASAAGTAAGLRDVIANSLASSAPVNAAMAQVSGTAKALGGDELKKIADVGANALGNAAADLVYTPVTPCRLFDTRASQGGSGTPALGIPRTVGAITPVANQGGPGGCAAPSGTAVALVSIGTLTPTGSGVLQGGPQGTSSFTNALILYQPGDQYGTTVAMPLNAANGQFDLVELFAQADLYGDLLGYFRAPQGGYVSSVGAGTGISIGGSATAPTVGIAAGGVGTTQLAAQAVTLDKTAAATAYFCSGLGASPASTRAYLSCTVQVTVPAGPSRVLTIASHKQFGSTAVGGAADLDLYICYQPNGGTLTTLGFGIFDNRVAQNIRTIFGMTAQATLAAGTYTMGLCGSTTQAANWNSNEFSYTTVTMH